LFLKKQGDEYSPYWYALGPVNEQLHGERDPWVVWVKEFLQTAPDGEGGAR
jgi:hypothetical protein